MSLKPRPQPQSRQPSPGQVAKALYGPAFAHADRQSIQVSMREFQQLSPQDRLFIQCHLLYLNVCAQERTQQILKEILEGQDQLMGPVFAIADEVTKPPLASLWEAPNEACGLEGNSHPMTGEAAPRPELPFVEPAPESDESLETTEKENIHVSN